MRWQLLNTYDKIYTIDLHGNAKKKEVAPDGSKDENVFDIMQGVSINLFIKTGNKRNGELAEVYHFDLYGKRSDKYKFLTNNSLKDIGFLKIPNKAPNYFMVQKDYESQEKYLSGINISELFTLNSVGIATHRDKFTIHSSKSALIETLDKFKAMTEEESRGYFSLGKDVRDWKVSYAKKDVLNNYKDNSNIVRISYRPFDNQWTLYTGNSKGFHSYPRDGVMSHLINNSNLALIVGRQGQAVGSMQWNLAFVTNSISDLNIYYRGGGVNFPLYSYPDRKEPNLDSSSPLDGRKPNLHQETVDSIADKIGLQFTTEKERTLNTFSPIDILDYIYAVLYSPTYRETYKEFLKTDFPRVPYPKDAEQFWQLVELGGQLRQVHLLESPKLAEKAKALGISYPKGGNNEVTRKMTKSSIGFEPSEDDATTGKVWINDEQYCDNIPLVAWEFYIGGYQPAQKWLKDRNGRTLNMSDIKHYINVIVALSLTDELMQQIDEIYVVG